MGNRYRSHFEDEKGLLRPNKTFVGNPSLEAYFGSFNVLAWSDPFRLIGDSMHLHAYRLEKESDNSFKLSMQARLSTDVEGIGTCLGLQAEARVELEQIVLALQAKLSPSTLFVPV